MFVGMWMTQDVVTIAPELTLAAAARLMSEKKIRRLPVVGTFAGEERLIGILSASDIVRAVVAKTVADAMTPHPLTIAADAPIETAASIMRECKIGALPVMRGNVLVGMITESDVFDAFASLFDLSMVGARMTFDISKGEDVLPFVTELAARHGVRITSFASVLSHRRPMCVLHVAGENTEPFLEELWNSNHRVESVFRTGPKKN